MGGRLLAAVVGVLCAATGAANGQEPEPVAVDEVETTAEASSPVEVPTAESEEPPPVEEPARGEARRHFQQGLLLMESENFEGALLEFERSLDLHPTRAALFNLGMCQKALFRYTAAIETFRVFLDRYREEAAPEELQRVAEAVQELRSLLAELTLDVNLPGAEIFLDGTRVGVSPMMDPIQVAAGRHVVEARLDGYATDQETVTVVSRDRRTVELELVELSRVGALRVESNVPGAELRIDGEPAGSVPYRGVLPEGSHEVEVSAEGMETQVQTVVIASGDERILTVTLQRADRGTHPAWFWSMAGLAVAGGAATTALGVIVLEGGEEYADDPLRTPAQQDDGKRLMIVTDVCLGVSVAAAVAAVVLAFTTDWGGEEAPATDEGPDTAGFSWSPSLGAVEAPLGLSLVGRF